MEQATTKKFVTKNNIISASGDFIDIDTDTTQETSGENITWSGLEEEQESKKQIIMTRKKTSVMRDNGNSANLTKQ